MGAFDRPFDILQADPHAAFQAPQRIYLPAFDEADQLDEPPAWRARRLAADDIEYVRVDRAAVADRGPATAAGLGGAAAGPATGRTGDSIVARWCAGWGDERPSRAVQRAMAEDIDRAIATALEAASPRRRSGAARRTTMVDQLALELAETGPQGAATLAGPAASNLGSGADRLVSLPLDAFASGRQPLPVSTDWTRLDAYRVVLWSNTNVEALARLAASGTGLPVTLYPEPANPVDPEAIALVVEASDESVGGLAVERAPALRVIGYVARAETRKASLFAALARGEAVAQATLNLEPEGWHAQVARLDPTRRAG